MLSDLTTTTWWIVAGVVTAAYVAAICALYPAGKLRRALSAMPVAAMVMAAVSAALHGYSAEVTLYLYCVLVVLLLIVFGLSAKKFVAAVAEQKEYPDRQVRVSRTALYAVAGVGVVWMAIAVWLWP
ncbi:hypothetical protein [Streptomyces sp. NBC_00102]|uniref:hypothetical protein n=1 Tax=Streptomyces sp. NBC_00102 TaxID=2975652 RepID=UPI002256536A|nr:hypothetical protein [Streptomyces sp. NBC_00102]MCX5399089.1 hypothetical protein [Streptomyces sp. NBC_00102]